ncbi:uncharacterized protein LOC120280181 isoform X1 [Dioscorea cayenensis subsp. rotundata]|uniref:Uncharacterized protein LOC120280181 isoform X1 n=1 Tax=Dioscorea cayennensis subsp. rotundata TaxID=55577 RepID=A0AB40CS35_DIOCR|nr:uncharacterized protein LOC120280181 isoform X1 [Dioscorea cayenensis subsp. rotundata]XP_039142865.1 uncharacterized protein LOC120280181 isoform X1 [Dioscorea cayenensis subsp. rotundata]XP_039142866.1 uncharacterized protein LOC120280181 isoform X1 [Dioscorea cayenensis subsp. rotundata]XP_039142867.1 uncharacterized protein LOC120280181 isoform X1 [Dioscorea cayenensis subsp. rotundata]XP_039142868.1 uncharacterized protein LOC120280181 isoform X1 [Dioscorea cayenensis subsp. rotundata]
MGHRQFLDSNHKFRVDKKSFDGTEEFKIMPNPPSTTEILHQLEGFQNEFGKGHSNLASKRRRLALKDSKDYYNWKKKSIFFELPYWEHNLVQHNLDVMHIEKNICDSLLGTLLNIAGKSKDTLKARLDLCEMKIRTKLHPIGVGNKTYIPPAFFTMNIQEKEKFCTLLKNVKVPDGYSSNISRCVNLRDLKVIGLKSHDCHVMIHQLLPIAIWRTLSKPVVATLVELCSFFRELCSKKVYMRDLDRLQLSVVQTLCNLERIFPPAFFDVMIHLVVHLATEAKLAGPVQYHWMYPIERYLLTLKSYVRNRSRPEGSIAEGYIVEECITFCSRYFEGVDTRFYKTPRNDDFGDPFNGHGIGKSTTFTLNPIEWKQAHRYMLFNSESLDYCISEHKAELKRQNRWISTYELDKMHHQKFDEWIFHKVQNVQNSSLPVEVIHLAKGPDIVARSYNAFTINGFRFHVKARERKRKIQNSGVVVVASTMSFASTSDKNPIESEITYFGVLNNIIELNYHGWKRIVLFKCEWIDVTKGTKKDDLGFTLVNLNQLSNTGANEYDEPFILASQALQAFYVEDPSEPNWHVAIQTKPRDFYDMQNDPSNEDYLQSIPCNELNLVDDIFSGDNNINWERTDMEGVMVDEAINSVDIDTLMKDSTNEYDEDTD